MALNRFVSPIQSPTNYNPYILPFEQMQQTLMFAQQQQDASREGLYNILDYDFPYIPVDANKEVYGQIKQSIDQGVDDLVGTTNGDLRGLRGDIMGMSRDLKRRATRQDGDIYKLAQDYAGYQAWENSESTKKIRESEPATYMKYKNKYLTDLQNAGGSLNSSFNTEQIIASPNFSKLAFDYSDKIEHDLIEYARTQPGALGYDIRTIEQAKEFLSPEKVMQVVTNYVGNDKDVQSWFEQNYRHGFLKEEQLPFINFSETKNAKGETIQNASLNPNNPAYSSFLAAVNQRSFNRTKDKQSYSIDSGLYRIALEEQEKKNVITSTGPMTSTSDTGYNNLYGPQIDQILETAKTNPALASQQLRELGNSNDVNNLISKAMLNPEMSKVIDTAYNRLKGNRDKNGNVKDKNGKIITKEELTRALFLSSMGDDGVIASTGRVLTGRANLQSVLNNLGYNFSKDDLGLDWTNFSRRTLFGAFNNFSDNTFKSELYSPVEQPVIYSLPNDPVWKFFVDETKNSKGSRLYTSRNVEVDGTPYPAGTNVLQILSANSDKNKEAGITNISYSSPLDGKNTGLLEWVDKSGKPQSMYVTDNSSFSSSSSTASEQSGMARYAQSVLSNANDFTKLRVITDQVVKAYDPYVNKSFEKNPRNGQVVGQYVKGNNTVQASYVKTGDNNGYYQITVNGVSTGSPINNASREEIVFRLGEVSEKIK